MDPEQNQQNQGYQAYRNNENFQIYQIQGPDKVHQFQLPSYYKPCRYLGSGAFGVVCSAIDLRKSESISLAIKKIELGNSHPLYLKRYLREIKIMRVLNHKTIIKLIDIVLPKSRQQFSHLYLALQVLGCDLHQAIRGNSLTMQHIQYFTCKILQGLDYLHSCGILHRDLKPNNILVNTQNQLRISDFGLARVVIENGDPQMTENVVTRWYRCPQLMMGYQRYTESVDIWSAGCVIAEMLLGKPLFTQNSSERQLRGIIEFTGFKQNDAQFYGVEFSQYIRSKLQINGQLEGNIQKLRQKSPEGADLVAKMLRLSPNQRLSIRQALKHPFITSRCRPKMVTVTEQPFKAVQFEFESMNNINRDQYMDMIYEEVLLYHFSGFREEYMSKLNNQMSVISHIVRNNGQTTEQGMGENL